MRLLFNKAIISVFEEVNSLRLMSIIMKITISYVTQAIDLGADRAVSVVLIVFADVTLLGLRDLYIQKKVCYVNDIFVHN